MWISPTFLDKTILEFEIFEGITTAEDDRLSDSIEVKIASELWRWALSGSNPPLKDQLSSDFEILLEFYLCGLVSEIPFTKSRGIWCDGVVELEITKPQRCRFFISGVIYSPHQLAPFELEFFFAKRRDKIPLFLRFRWGELNKGGQLRKYGNKFASEILLNRPRSNRDWAVAVELSSENSG